MFVHLHLHTQYSLLQGAIRVEDLFEKVKQLGMNAVAMTDMHNLFGAIDFYQSAKEAGVKPIVGIEIRYVNHIGAQRSHHLVLLCKDLQGYQNLCQMVTQSYTELKGVVDQETLSRFGDGLIVLSGCLKGELASKILLGDEESALESLRWFKKRFGEDFYLELQDCGLPEQTHVNHVLYEWGKKNQIQCVATNDCHYLESHDCEAHEILQCVEYGRNLDFDRPASLVPPEFHIKSPQEMQERFSHYPGAVENTLVIANRCNLDFKFKDSTGKKIYHLPKFVPHGISTEVARKFDSNSYFAEQAHLGLKKRMESHAFLKKRSQPDWSELEKIYFRRLEDEIQMIQSTGFASYFLIVADFINWAKNEKIPVGPGRGSGAGSLVAYSLRITDIDPIQFKLLFERFINPERISMPDFDVDFCQDRRGEVIDYVSKRYGAENVCQIITFGKLQARAVIKDVGRVLGLSFAESDSITKLLPEELDITIDKAIEKEPRLRDRIENEPKVAKIIEYARKLEGLYRNAGIHAAGVIITEKPVVNYCALFVGKDGDRVTQFDKDFCETIGLIKFDFLGLKTLTVIDNAIKLIGPQFDLEKMDYEDPKVFALISSGDTDGVFQVESSGMKDLCTRIQPSSLEDLTAINALYRPGPLGSGMVDDFIDRKHGRKVTQYAAPALESILKDTYGVILYQEQVMQTARELAGYSLGQADLLRRAMGKKKPEEMAEHRQIFVKGATEKGLTAHKAESIFDLMAKFAEYGFNKSHSAAYGVLTYQTAYLKTYYPSEFMAALMTTEMDNTDKITKYISDAKAHDIVILPPDVNRSQRRFSVEEVQVGNSGKSKKGIRFGLEAIKGCGGVAVDLIIEKREEKSFSNVLDFCSRVPLQKVNKKVLESLTMAGAFDSIAEVNRATVFASLEKIMSHANDEQEERELGQSSLFDALGSDEIKPVVSTAHIFSQQADWPQSKKLTLEKQVVGFYVSGHPMDAWQSVCEEWLGWSTEILKNYAERKAAEPVKEKPVEKIAGPPHLYRVSKPEIKIAGLLSDVREITTKKGSKMAFGAIEDLKGKIELIYFPEAYGNVREFLQKAMSEAEPVLLHGEIELAPEGPKIFVKSLEWLAETHKNRVQKVTLKLSPEDTSPAQLRELKKSLLQHRGKCSIQIEFIDPQYRASLPLPSDLTVAATPQFFQSVQKIFGRNVISLK